ncbi:uncharacterized protein LOC112501249 [Cynara cardunculus var. scolymus]|uniref:Endoplasmic reticulum transmembrane protein n=1 Tax=Cynara cardunculus var. scolymus TaxID=59895 RepID=A0A118K0Y2_CYNCS|nr:uncharacterized protein LOC112501249 [Cynara cardunculus var. scolymus]KVI02028.1 B-cell receptor-associated 31-like protein [Cynara cardunculus var. scolymus]
MIYVFFMVLFAEMAIILLLMFKTPLRKLLILALDRMKRGRAPLIVKSVVATIFTIMLYQIYNVSHMRRRPGDAIGPTDQIILAYQMLEASLIGFSIFLSLMIDRLHHYIRELRMLRKKQNQTPEGGKNNAVDEINALNEEISRLTAKIRRLESENANKEKKIKSAEMDSGGLKNQSEGFRVEYERLQSENRSLTDGLRTIEGTLSNSGGKKDK